jgi:D-amino-acid oxidase
MMSLSTHKLQTIIVGCGVSGLTCGIRLLEKQFPVTILARDLPPNTTSNLAAAVWYPYEVRPSLRVFNWSRHTLRELYELASIAESGVSLIIFTELLKQPLPDPWWKDAVRFFRRATTEELPPGYQDGYVFEVPLIETPIYMQYLMARFQKLGGLIEQKTVSALSELYRERQLIINCAGLGASTLVPDDKLYPIRGQIVRVKASGVKRSLVADSSDAALSYIVPRSQDCILGGTAEKGNGNLKVVTATAKDILRKCKQLEPALENVEELEHLVGLRPGREGGVRLKMERVFQGCAIIHNYGHGGSGFTLSWGCAEAVTKRAEKLRAKLVV